MKSIKIISSQIVRSIKNVREFIEEWLSVALVCKGSLHGNTKDMRTLTIQPEGSEVIFGALLILCKEAKATNSRNICDRVVQSGVLEVIGCRKVGS